VNVTLTVWRIPQHRAPRVLWRLARDRGRLRNTPGVRFAKLLGISADFQRMDPSRWAALIVADTGEIPALRRWRELATAECQLHLRPLTSKGRWSGAEPFQATPQRPPDDAEVLALTRARLRPGRAARFWRAIGPVARAATTAPGLVTSFGIGEAPMGWQGTVSLWRSDRHLVEFAYHHPDHRRVLGRIHTEEWYAEELYARFAVDRVDGDRRVIGWE
jgi:hypothetical protein